MGATLLFKLRLLKGIIKIHGKRTFTYLFILNMKKLSPRTRISAVKLQMRISSSGTEEQILATLLGETAPLSLGFPEV